MRGNARRYCSCGRSQLLRIGSRESAVVSGPRSELLMVKSDLTGAKDAVKTKSTVRRN